MSYSGLKNLPGLSFSDSRDRMCLNFRVDLVDKDKNFFVQEARWIDLAIS